MEEKKDKSLEELFGDLATSLTNFRELLLKENPGKEE